MGVGDVGADEFGNVTRLTAAQQQSYITGALALGASRADVDSFIANNGVNDLARINQALDLHAYAAPVSSSPGGTVNTTSPSKALEPAAAISDGGIPGYSGRYGGINPGGTMYDTGAQYSTPTPVSSSPAITPDAGDSRIFGSGPGSGGFSSSSPVSLSVAAPAASSGFPMWLLLALAGLAVLAFVMDGRGNRG